MSQSEKNLSDAFAGESQANRTYLAFAKKAEEEGQAGVAALFRAAAEAETIHAHNHLNAMGKVKSTLENLEAAYGGEHHEFTDMYPGFIDQARKEGNNDAAKTFYWANEVEKVHGALCQKAIDALKAKKPFELKDYYVCGQCGYTAEDNPPDVCPVCGAKKELFRKV
jgi:rubrerythrin